MYKWISNFLLQKLSLLKKITNCTDLLQAWTITGIKKTLKTRVLEQYGSPAMVLQCCYIHTHTHTQTDLHMELLALYPRLAKWRRDNKHNLVYLECFISTKTYKQYQQ